MDTNNANAALDFFNSSSDWSKAFGGIWEAIYNFMKPLVTAAEGLEKLLKLIK